MASLDSSSPSNMASFSRSLNELQEMLKTFYLDITKEINNYLDGIFIGFQKKNNELSGEFMYDVCCPNYIYTKVIKNHTIYIIVEYKLENRG